MSKVFETPKRRVSPSYAGRLALSLLAVLLLGGCAMMSSTGPSSRAVSAAKGHATAESQIRVVDVSDAVATQLITAAKTALFSESLGEGYPIGTIVGLGDVLDISIWEAPPAALFGSAGADTRFATSSTSIARGTSLPTQVVDNNGLIQIPFVGAIRAEGRTLQVIADDIKKRLARKANQPQVIVRMAGNAASNVTVIGDVANSTRMPLTPKGERLLDALASAGGVKQAVGKMTVQITRGRKVESLPLQAVIQDPKQNIRLQPDDVVTILFQPYTFTALGATGRNEEIPFEGTGLSLAQALGRVGGLQDQRADAKGVFIFRFEDRAALGYTADSTIKTTTKGKIPVIYRVDLKSPETFFAAQNFPIRDKDVLYVSNAPLADLQKFLAIISSTVVPLYTLDALVNNNN